MPPPHAAHSPAPDFPPAVLPRQRDTSTPDPKAHKRKSLAYLRGKSHSFLGGPGHQKPAKDDGQDCQGSKSRARHRHFSLGLKKRDGTGQVTQPADPGQPATPGHADRGEPLAADTSGSAGPQAQASRPAMFHLDSAPDNGHDHHLEFVTPAPPARAREPVLRPSYHRSISYQSQVDKDDDSDRTSTAESEQSVSRADAAHNAESVENSPKKLRARSRTLGDVTAQHVADHTPAGFVIMPSKSKNDPATPGSAPPSAPLHGSRSSLNMFSALTNFVKSRRSSSVVLDESAADQLHGLSPASGPSDRSPSVEAHSAHTPQSDYFAHRSGISPAGHRHTSSVSSLDRFPPLEPLAGEDPHDYINRLVHANHITDILPLICTRASDYNHRCLQYYVGFFDFSGEPVDFSLRKFLAFNELPKETQQIDRVLNAFAAEYCAQNPQLNYSTDVCFILTFSLLILHTDHFNHHNRRKMTKLEFVRIVKESLQDHLDKASDAEKALVESTVKNIVTRDILEYFYDNITYSSFKRLDDCTKEMILLVNDNRAAEALQLSEVEPEVSLAKSLIKTNLSSASLTAGGAVSRRRASSFFSINSTATDPLYDYILAAKDKTDLLLSYEFQLTNPFVGMDVPVAQAATGATCQSSEDNILTDTEDKMDEIDTAIFAQLVDNFLHSRPKRLLRLDSNRAQSLSSGLRVELLSDDGPCPWPDVPDAPDAGDVAVRVFKMGTVYRQELKKLSSGTVWKPYYVLLTSIGLLCYKDVTCLKMAEVGDDDAVLIEEQLPSGLFETSADASFSVLIHGLFAMRQPPDVAKKSAGTLASKLEQFKFTVYGRNSKDVYAVSAQDDLKDWVYNIDYLAALNDCYLHTDSKPIEFLDGALEMRVQASATLLQKVNKSNKALTTSLEALKKLMVACENLKSLMPFNGKTRELTVYSAKLLDTRMNWCWFELNKNLIVLKILLHTINTADEIDDEENGSERNAESLHGKTIASVSAVLEYDIAESTFWDSAEDLAESGSPGVRSGDSSFHDCEAGDAVEDGERGEAAEQDEQAKLAKAAEKEDQHK